MSAIHFPHDKPKSLVVFIAGLAIGLLVFLPLAVVGLTLEKITMFLTGSAGVAVSWLLAGFMGFLFAYGLRAGRYKDMHERPWRQQVW
jgi:hypothetical protein